MAADPDAAPVEMCTSSPRCRKQLLARRIVNNRLFESSPVLVRKGDSKHWKAVYKIRRSIQRVDDPEVLIATAGPAFLCQYTVIRMSIPNDADNLLFRETVDFGHVFVLALG